MTVRRLAALAISVIVAIGTVARAEAIGGNKRVSSDEVAIGADANAVLAHHRYATLRWAPGTPALFAVATRLSGHRSLRVGTHAHGPAQYAQLAVELVTMLAATAIAWRLAGPLGGVLAAFLLAFYGPLILVTRTYLSEPFGGLAMLATFAVAAWARRRGLRALLLAGLVAGLAALVREDLMPGIVLIAVALAAGRRRQRGRRRAALEGLAYLLVAAAAIAPWAAYASSVDGRFVPITDGGVDSLFIGTYLPGGGTQPAVIRSFRHAVCVRLPRDCAGYDAESVGPMFRLIASRSPHLSFNSAIAHAVLENLRRYALGHPAAFVAMLARKLWDMWAFPWSGEGYARYNTSLLLHQIFVGLAWLGLLAGALLIRSWSLVTVTLGLVAITLLNVLVNAQARDNLRLLPLLFTFGAVGLVRSWPLLVERSRQGKRLPCVGP